MAQRFLSFVSVFIFCSTLIAAPARQDEETSTQLKNIEALEKSAQGDSKVLAAVDIRPTASLKGQDSFRFENWAQLGYAFSPVFQVVYHQDFWMNLYNSQLAGGADGLGLIAQDGYFDWFRDRVFQSQDKTLTLSYEGRLYVPTFSSRREAGMITAFRNYLILGKKLNDVVSVTLVEAPIVHAYSQSAHNGKANPLVENRVTLEVAFNLTSKLNFSLPMAWSATKMRRAPGQINSDSIQNFVWINPELSYAVDANYALGVGYYDTTSLIKSDFSAFQVGEGLEDGVVQCFLRASL